MSRVDISMTPNEVESFLARCGTMAVGAIGEDGWPVATLARTAFRDGVLSVELPAGDPVLDALATDERVCCTADEHARYDEIRGVIVHGRAWPDRSGRADVEVDRVLSFDFGRIPPVR